MAKPTPQAYEVLDYLKQHGKIDPMTALSKLGVYRLAARILELRQNNFDIETVLVKVRPETSYAKYIYKGEKKA